jgi:purine-binding chemotaxis protein CheW
MSEAGFELNASDVLSDLVEYVTVHIGTQLFGIPIHRVQDVFLPEAITAVPLADPEIAGVLNLRGRIVTASDMRCRLGLPPREMGGRVTAIGVENKGEAFGMLVDSVGEVLKLAPSVMEPNPVNLHMSWARVSSGVYRLDGQLLVVLDVDHVLNFSQEAMAA